MTVKKGNSARLSLSHAERISAELRQHHLGVEHIFLGVDRLEDINIRRHLSDAGIEPDGLAALIREKATRFAGPTPHEGFMTPRAKKALGVATKEAEPQGGTIEAPHLVIAVLTDPLSLPARAMRELGGDPRKAVDGLRGMLADGEWSSDFYSERRAVEQPGLSKTSELMQALGRDLTELARQGKLSPLIGRHKELLEMVSILTQKRKNNPLLVGDAGVGKTAIVEGLAQLLAQGSVVQELKGKRIRTVEVGALVAGAGVVGELERRLNALIEEARGDSDLIIFIDEIHMLVGAGAAQNHPQDLANLLKPALSGGEIKCIGATTHEEYRRYIEKDPALERRFAPVYIEEPTREDTLRILEGLRARYESFHQLRILDEALQAAVDFSIRYIGDRKLPDKAIDVLDRACAETKLRTYYGYEDLSSLSEEEKRAVFAQREDAPGRRQLAIGADDIAHVVAAQTGIPVGRLTEGESDRLMRLEELLGERVIGQDEAVAEVADSIRMSRAGMGHPKRPIGCFLFLGPTGVGKTELAKTLAWILFDDEERMVRVDMSECWDAHHINRLIGSPPGFVDSERGGMLTEAVRKHPYSVVLLDEIEKAHPAVHNLLLQVMEDGRLTDAMGRTADFRNTVVIMTSNVGSKAIQGHKRIGYQTAAAAAGEELSSAEVHGAVDGELKRVFPPEFLNRFDEVVVFNPLPREVLVGIARLMLGKVGPRIEATDAAIRYLVDVYHDPAMGARPIRRAVDDFVREPLAKRIVSGALRRDQAIELDVVDGELTVEASGGGSGRGATARAGEGAKAEKQQARKGK